MIRRRLPVGLALVLLAACGPSSSGPPILTTGTLGSARGGDGGSVLGSGGRGTTGGGSASPACYDPTKGGTPSYPQCGWVHMTNGQSVTLTGIPETGSTDGGASVSISMTASEATGPFATTSDCAAASVGWTVTTPGFPAYCLSGFGSTYAIDSSGTWEPLEGGGYSAGVCVDPAAPPPDAGALTPSLGSGDCTAFMADSGQVALAYVMTSFQVISKSAGIYNVAAASPDTAYYVVLHK